MAPYITNAHKLDFANPKLERIGIIPIVRGATEETTYFGLGCNRRGMLTSIGGGAKIACDHNGAHSLLREFGEELGDYLTINWTEPNDWLAIVDGESYTLLPELDRIPEKEFTASPEIVAFLWIPHTEARRLYDMHMDRDKHYSEVYFGKFLTAIFPTLLNLEEIPRETGSLNFVTEYRDEHHSDKERIRSTEEFFEILTNNPLHFHDCILFYYSPTSDSYLFTDGRLMYSVANTEAHCQFLADFVESRKRKHFVFFTMGRLLRTLPRRAFRVGSVETYHGNTDYKKELQEYCAKICTTDREQLLAIIKFERDVYEKKAQTRINPNDVKRLEFMKEYYRSTELRRRESL